MTRTLGRHHHRFGQAFAAGADIKGSRTDLTFADAFTADFFATWGKLAAVRHPDDRRGGGIRAARRWLRAAMMCDVLIAADTAKFGRPEIKLGVLPGMGGSG
ncbi:enoyl-CoA hydratase-related protein [Mycobacterium tuberculosis]